MQSQKRDFQAIPRARREVREKMEDDHSEMKQSRYEKGALCQEEVAEIMQKKAKMAE